MDRQDGHALSGVAWALVLTDEAGVRFWAFVLEPAGDWSTRLITPAA